MTKAAGFLPLFAYKVTFCYAKNIKKRYPDKSIGILVPYNDQITQVARVLTDNNLEFEELGPNSLNKRRMLVNISYIIDFILKFDYKKELDNHSIYAPNVYDRGYSIYYPYGARFNEELLRKIETLDI